MLSKLKQIKRYCTFHATWSFFSPLSIVLMLNTYPLLVTSVDKILLWLFIVVVVAFKDTV